MRWGALRGKKQLWRIRFGTRTTKRRIHAPLNEGGPGSLILVLKEILEEETPLKTMLCVAGVVMMDSFPLLSC